MHGYFATRHHLCIFLPIKISPNLRSCIHTMAGDVILAVDDHYLFTAEELDAEIKHHKPGTQVAVRYRNYSRIYDTSLVVGSGR